MSSNEFAAKAVHQFPIVKSHVEEVFDDTKSMASYLKKRLQIEQNYIKELQSLAKTSKFYSHSDSSSSSSSSSSSAPSSGALGRFGRKKIGLAFAKKARSSNSSNSAVPSSSVMTCWKDLSLHTQQIADNHTKFANTLERVVLAEFQNWLKTNDPIKKKLSATGESHLKKRTKTESDMESAKKKYISRSKDHEKAQKQLESKPNAEPDEKKKLTEKVKSTKKKRDEAERAYASSVQDANKVLNTFYGKNMPAVLTGLQNLEYTRFELFKDQLSKFIGSFTENVPQPNTIVFEGLSTSLSSLDYPGDISSFVTTIKGSPEKPPDFRVEYYRGENDPSALTSKDVKKMAGKRVELEKTLETLINRLTTDVKGRDGIANMLNAGSLGDMSSKAEHDLEAYETNIAHMENITKQIQALLKDCGGNPDEFGPIPQASVALGDPPQTHAASQKSSQEMDAYGEEEYVEEEYYEEGGEYYEEAGEEEVDVEKLNATPIGGSVRALYEYNAEGDGELNLYVGAIITVISKDDSGWWQGSLDGVEGAFPSNYCAPT